jgi:Family of unknown function (DUF6130)
VLDDGKLNEWLDPLCEHNHASGHVHITVDDAPWHFVDASGETLIVVGLKPGPNKMLVELADPTHGVIDHQTVSFVVPQH